MKPLTMTDVQELGDRRMAADEWPPQSKGELANALNRAHVELDATRERLAAAERDATFGAPVIVDAYKAALAAREAECVELRAALASHLVGPPDHERWCNGDGKQPCDCGAQEVWDEIPWVIEQRALLARPSGGYAALRARMEEAWRAGALYSMGGGNPSDGPPWGEEDDNRMVADIARLLPAPQAQGETPS